MEWFWDAYTTDPAQRREILASPNQASIEQVAATNATRAAIAQATTILRPVRNRLRDERALRRLGERSG